MAGSYTRRISLYINGKEVKNDIASIKREMGKLINEQSRMTFGSKEYNAQFKKIARLKGILEKHRQELRNVGRSWTSIAAEKVNKYFGLVASGIASVTGIAIAYKRAADASNHFEERLDNLSALTGLSGSKLEQLGQTAKDTSVKITDGGVRIKQSADDIVDAYTKVGSQRPELLKDADALAKVTEDAIILSEAAKSDLEPAVKGLTTTMNQFNVPASESRRVINAMAAGSKEGAADIPYLTQAVEKSGTTMHLMNVSLEENIGLIESIAPNYAKAEMAGNSLDKVFLKLKEKQIGYKDGVFDVNLALDELAKRYKNGESAASIFGVEHAKMGELLVQNRDEFNRYTKAVTGTNVAIEQARKNTDNAAAKIAQAKNDFHIAAVELGKNLSPAMTKLYQVAGSVALAFSKMIAKSPVESLKEEQTEVNRLVVELKSANIEENRRKEIIEKLKEVAPDLAKTITDEKTNIEDLTEALKGYNDEMALKILIASGEEEIANQKAKVDTMRKLNAQFEAELATQMRNSIDWFEKQGPEVRRKAESILYDTQKSILQKGRDLNSLALEVTTLGNANLFMALDSYVNFQDKYSNELQNLDALITRTKNTKDEWEKVFGDNSSLNNDGINQIFTEGEKELYAQIEKDKNEADKSLQESIDNFGEYKKLTLDSLELAHQQQIVSIKQFYADKEQLKKEANARLLAADIAFLQAKAQLETDEQKKLDLQSQIIDAQQKYSSALKEAVPELISIDNATGNLNARLLEQAKLMEFAAQKQQKAQQAQQETTEKQKRQTETIQMIGGVMTDFISSQLSGTADQFETFGDTLILMSLQILKQMVPIWSAQILGYSLADPISVATVGVKGMINYAAIMALLYTGISAAEGAVKSGISKRKEASSNKGYESGGFTQGEAMYLAGEKNKKEWIGPNWMVNDPMIGPIIQSLEEFRIKRYTVNPQAIEATKTTTQRTNPAYTSNSTKPESNHTQPYTTAPGITNENIENFTEAINRLTKWKPKVYAELIKKDLDTLEDIDNRRGM